MFEAGMGRRADPLGKLLRRMGALSEEALEDALDHQRHTLPIASLCYILGHADEETLVHALSRQFGTPGVALDRSVIDLSILKGVPRQLAMRHSVLPVLEDQGRLFVACQDPEAVNDVLGDFEFIKGRSVVPHIALKVTLERTLRACYKMLIQSATVWKGKDADSDTPFMWTVTASSADDLNKSSLDSQQKIAFASVVEEVTKEMNSTDLLQIETTIDESGSSTRTSTTVTQQTTPFDGLPDESSVTDGDSAPTGIKYGQYRPDRPRRDHNLAEGTPAEEFVEPPTVARDDDEEDQPTLPGDVDSQSQFTDVDKQAVPNASISDVPTAAVLDPEKAEISPAAEFGAEDGAIQVIDMARRAAPHKGPLRVLIVDDDPGICEMLVDQLKPHGYLPQVATDGGAAVRLITSDPPDAVIIDTDLPEVDGFQISRAIKQSHKYSHIPVVLLASRVDADKYTKRDHAADAFFEKPIDVKALRQKLGSLLRSQRPPVPASKLDENFERAIELYRDGKIDGAVDALRKGISIDPTSARHHFVLANLLQKQAQIYEAIDEYEVTVDLKPDYFPALTRLAYLYYKKGFAAKAIETWRRALPFCPDPGLRRNIEVFMRKLIADMAPDR